MSELVKCSKCQSRKLLEFFDVKPTTGQRFKTCNKCRSVPPKPRALTHNCPQCKYKSYADCMIKRHVKQVHDKIQDYQCLECDYTCCAQGVLNNHVRATHENVKRYYCPYCEHASFASTNMTSHIKALHFEIKDQQCDQCPYVCARPGDLLTHKRQFHDRERNHHCSTCNYECFALSDLTKHLPLCTGEEHISAGEYAIRGVLDAMSISHTREMRFGDCRDKNPLPFDFYIPTIKVAIEFDGRQHFEPIDRFGGVIGFNNIKKRDTIKTQYCADQGIRLLRIPYSDFDRIESLIKEFVTQ